jgi:hypothetical protein
LLPMWPVIRGSWKRTKKKRSRVSEASPRSDRPELDKGRTLETTGDGMLIEFANAVQAARRLMPTEAETDVTSAVYTDALIAMAPAHMPPITMMRKS